jgi:hypothetical protein
MATRTFDVYETGDLFKVRLSVTGSKKARIVRHHLQGYASIKAARADGCTRHSPSDKREADVYL